MDKNISKKVKILVAENELEEALNLMIRTEEEADQERHHTLLLLRNRLTMLEEQELAGILDFDEVARQKAKIAHSLLKMTEGKTPEVHLPPLAPPPQNKPRASTFSTKYLFIGLFVVAAVVAFFLIKSSGEKTDIQPKEPATQQDEPQKNDETKTPENSPPIRLVDFPMLGKPFNFSDIRYTFREANLEKYSDGSASESAKLKLTLKMDLVCSSNFGICYREEIRVFTDGKPIAPSERTNLAGWLEHNSSAEDVQTFIFDADAKEYHLELEKNKSTWRRAFKILK